MIFWLCALAVFASDRLTKTAITSSLDLGEFIAVIPGVLHVTFVLNPGGAFGLLPRGTLFFTIVTFAVFMSVITYYIFWKPGERVINVALGLVLGGTAGNLYDRLVIGEVVDWIDFRIWPVFNFADMALVTGLGLLSFLMMRPNEARDE